MLRALLLVNRHARRGEEDFLEADRHLRELGFDLITQSTDHCQDFSSIIHQHHKQIDLVIIGGGDGTLNAAVEGLVETQLPLGILPLGTANDLARTLGIPPSLPEACQIIFRGQLRRIDLGQVNGKHFFNVASLGLSVQITRSLTKQAKRRWGMFAYAATAFQVLWQARPFQAEIRVNGIVIRVKTVQITVGNGRYYGGGLTVADDATIDDQRLDLYSLEIQHWWEMLPLLLAMRQGRLAHRRGVRTLQGQEIEVYTQKPHTINTDGELTTQSPALFRIIPQAISVFVPVKLSNGNISSVKQTK